MQKYTLTLYIAAPGTPKTKGEPSISGHVYYSISDGEKSQGWGFAPTGFPYVSAPGIVEDDEFNIYQNPYYKRTMEITKEQYEALKAFGKNPEQYGFNKDWYAPCQNLRQKNLWINQ